MVMVPRQSCDIFNCIHKVLQLCDITAVYQKTFSVKINNFHIYFCSFDLSWSILEKDNFINNLYIVLSYYIVFFFNLVCYDHKQMTMNI